MDANLGLAFYDITLFLLGLCGVGVMKYLYEKLGQEKVIVITVAMMGIAIICFRWF